MRPPRFWQNSPDAPGAAAWLLTPLGALTARATARRMSRAGFRAAIPVICVGNINVGGTGKTPTVIALVQMLQARDETPAVLTRGFGGDLTGPVKVDPTHHAADQVGDEPLLIAAFGSVWVSRDRAAGARAAIAGGATVLLLDDGLQNPSLDKDLTIVTVDAAQGFGNGRVLPAGPLREPVAAGLARAKMVLSIGPDTSQALFRRRWGAKIAIPHITARLTPLATGMNWSGLRALAFAGIGRPEKFFETLRDLGADLVRTVALGDHQPLTPALITRLSAEASARGLQLVTTEKDAIRLPPDFRTKVLTLPIRLEFDQPDEIADHLTQLLDGANRARIAASAQSASFSSSTPAKSP